LINGISIRLIGIANDYVGKGMSGGKIVVRPPTSDTYDSTNSVVLGNTVLYGATGGCLYAAGHAAERFCVRNSGAQAVVEGCGDHGCEYMTGGIVVILGETGSNFGAGMSGGIAFVYDPTCDFKSRCNLEMVVVKNADANDGQLHELVRQHLEETGSPLAHSLLENWSRSLLDFRKIVPATAELPTSGELATGHAGAIDKPR
jgi:glutamate synthase domain-containing protein 3